MRVLVPPDPDQERHRDQHQLPEEIEEEEIEREEHAGHAGERPHQAEVEEPGAVRDLGPRRAHRDDAEEHREREQEQAHAVDREMDGDAERGNPRPDAFGDPRLLGGGAGARSRDADLRQRAGVISGGGRAPELGEQHQLEPERDQTGDATGDPVLAERPGGDAADQVQDDEREQDHA